MYRLFSRKIRPDRGIKPIRLAKYIAQQGYCSRRNAEDLIRRGEVRVNGIIAEISTPVDPEIDVVTISGEELSPEGKVYIILNKPPGYLSTCKPSREKGASILELIDISQRIYPVGRLDRESRGLLLLTNDGELAHKLAHPSGEVEKEYIVKLDAELCQSDTKNLLEGVLIEGGIARCHLIEKTGKAEYRMILKQGLKRQIRLMARAVGRRVIDLRRVREGTISLGNLPEGKYRYLTDREIKSLKRE